MKFLGRNRKRGTPGRKPKHLLDLLKQLFSDMSARLERGHYSEPGGYEVYGKDRDAVVQQCRKEPNKGVAAEAMLNEFMIERGPEANNILRTDQKLTENDRQIQLEEEKRALIEQKLKEEEEKRLESERMMQTERERQEDRMRQVQEKFNNEMEQMQQEMERALDSKLKEREELLNKGFQEKADVLNEEIKNLKKEKEEEKEKSGGFFKDVVLPILKTAVELVPAILNHKMMMKAFRK